MDTIKKLIDKKRTEYIYNILENTFWADSIADAKAEYSKRFTTFLLLLFFAFSLLISSTYILHCISFLKETMLFIYILAIPIIPVVLGIVLGYFILYINERRYVNKRIEVLKNDKPNAFKTCEKRYVFDFYQQDADQEVIDIIKLCFTLNEWQLLNMLKNGNIKYKDINKIINSIDIIRQTEKEAEMSKFYINSTSLRLHDE